MAENVGNKWSALLNGAIDSDDTSVAFDNAVGTLPDVEFRIVVQDAEDDDTNREIMLVTAGTATPLTVTRAQEGTTGVAHADNSYIIHVLTAGGLLALFEPVGSGVTVVGANEDVGASPLQVAVPGGIANGDLIVYAVQTVNSIPNAAGPSGSWNLLVRFDTSSNEWQAAYWKIASGESGTWDITHSAGVVAVAAAAVYRGVDTLWESAFNSVDLLTPNVLGVAGGLLVLVWFAANATSATDLVLASAHVTEDANVSTLSTTTAKLMIGHRDTYYEAGAGVFLATTSADTQYYGSLAAVFYKA